MLIGVISDTHGLLRDEAVRALAGASLVIHAGDVGRPDVLVRLAEVAPVFAVRGNVDTGAWARELARELPARRTVEAAGACLYVLHNVRELDCDPAAHGFRAVISGHSHKSSRGTKDGVLYLNPGSAGPRRFRLPVTVALLRVENGEVSAGIVALELA